jgi:AcrR family transcriptional regulator
MQPSKRTARYVPGPRRGDQRREALLRALEQLLETRTLAGIGIADITREAGVTRPAFYFYFATKAAAVAALLADFQGEMLEAAADWYEDRGGTPRDRLQSGFEASIAMWRDRAGLLVAMLDAVGADPEVRELWQLWTEEFTARIATRIEADIRKGVGLQVTDPPLLARLLMGAALSGMERDVRAIAAGARPSQQLAPALIELWYRALYGSA